MTDAAGVEAWKRQTTAFDRIQSVATAVSQPQSASAIAAEAHVAENTARDHLKRLVELNVLLERDQDGTTLYGSDPLHTRVQMIRELLQQHDRDSLIELKRSLQSQIEDWQSEYDIASATELRDRATETETAAQTRDIRQTASDWELISYRLSIVEDAIENYNTYSEDVHVSA